jgi:hypothetical protein
VPAASPPVVTGVSGTDVVAVDAGSGEVIAATLGGWSCTGTGRAQFDGSYDIDRLAVGHSYTVYAEPLDGVVTPAQIEPAIELLCRNSTTDAGCPAQQACVVPPPDTSFNGAHADGIVEPVSRY